MGFVKGVGGVVEILRERLSDLPSFIRAVILFGSAARGEAVERSDVDLLVLYEGLAEASLVKRRRLIYMLIMDRISGFFEEATVIDIEYREFVEPRAITPLLLNIYWDGIVVLDRVGGLGSFLEHVRKKIAEAGLKRVKDGRTYYWVLPKPMQRVKII